MTKRLALRCSSFRVRCKKAGGSGIASDATTVPACALKNAVNSVESRGVGSRNYFVCNKLTDDIRFAVGQCRERCGARRAIVDDENMRLYERIDFGR